jgi:hypothetical protein
MGLECCDGGELFDQIRRVRVELWFYAKTQPFGMKSIYIVFLQRTLLDLNKKIFILS